MAEPITTDELARLIQQEFTSIHGEIKDFRAEVNQRLGEHDRRFEVIDQKFDAIITVLKGIQDEIKDLKKDTYGELADLRIRVARLEDKVGIKS